ncbi:MAG: DUF427 domain-containing protein [Cyanobacteria bacterium J06642_2]
MFSRRIEPGPGQESVWDYPRPPKLEPTTKRIRAIYRNVAIADTRCAMRVLETSHPPVYYIPPQDIQQQYLEPSRKQSFCEWKGMARYYTIVVGGDRVPDAAWYYPEPTAAFAAMQNYVAIYPQLMDACYVDDELVQAQAGNFYGGWVTQDIVGPFKGGAGTWGW